MNQSFFGLAKPFVTGFLFVAALVLFSKESRAATNGIFCNVNINSPSTLGNYGQIIRPA